jgi:hypothetical protein
MPRLKFSIYAEDVHHFVAQVVDDLDGDSARFGFGEWT